MNVYKKREEILKANEGSKLTYDSKAEEFVFTFPKGNGFRIPGDCVYCGEHIYKVNSNTVIGRVERE